MALPERRVRHRGLLPDGRLADPHMWDRNDDESEYSERVNVRRPARRLRLATSRGKRMAAGRTPGALATRSASVTGSRQPSRTRH